MVDRLEKMNLVQRIRSDSDRRVIYVSTTDYFQEQFSGVRATAVDRFSDGLKDCSAEDIDAILKGLQLLNQALSEE